MSQILTATCWRNAFAVSSGQPPPLPHPGGRRVTGAVQGVVADRSGRSACGFAEEAGKFFATLKNTLAFVSKRITCLPAQPLGQFLVTRSGVFITTGFLSVPSVLRAPAIAISFVVVSSSHRLIVRTEEEAPQAAQRVGKVSRGVLWKCAHIRAPLCSPSSVVVQDLSPAPPVRPSQLHRLRIFCSSMDC
jgi:hypothetical protein